MINFRTSKHQRHRVSRGKKKKKFFLISKRRVFECNQRFQITVKHVTQTTIRDLVSFLTMRKILQGLRCDIYLSRLCVNIRRALLGFCRLSAKGKDTWRGNAIHPCGSNRVVVVVVIAAKLYTAGGKANLLKYGSTEREITNGGESVAWISQKRIPWTEGGGRGR